MQIWFFLCVKTWSFSSFLIIQINWVWAFIFIRHTCNLLNNIIRIVRSCRKRFDTMSQHGRDVKSVICRWKFTWLLLLFNSMSIFILVILSFWSSCRLRDPHNERFLRVINVTSSRWAWLHLLRRYLLCHSKDVNFLLWFKRKEAVFSLLANFQNTFRVKHQMFCFLVKVLNIHVTCSKSLNEVSPRLLSPRWLHKLLKNQRRLGLFEVWHPRFSPLELSLPKIRWKFGHEGWSWGSHLLFVLHRMEPHNFLSLLLKRKYEVYS